MNRRAFLRLIGGAGLGATLDRKYFFAPAGGWTPPTGPWQHFAIDFPKHGSYPLEIDGLGYMLSDLKMIEAMKFTVEEIAMVFRVPIHLIDRGPFYFR